MSNVERRDTVSLRALMSAGAVAALLAVGCGGSGSNDGAGNPANPNKFGSQWSGALTKVSDTCVSEADPQTLTFSHSVTQNDSAIQLSADSITYLGNTVGGNGFSVDANRTTSTVCTEQRRVEYDDVEGTSDNSADIDLTVVRNCGSAGSCTLKYSGTASRSTAPASSTASSSSSSSSPAGIVGGCADMNTRTVAGTYSGDGNCGISDAGLSFGSSGTSQTIILDPFGANGLTSFVLNAVTPQNAPSLRTDLTVKGEAGNSCNMVCSPPSTFTVVCTKEGGTQCVEKF